MDAIFELTVIDNGGRLRTPFSESSIATWQPRPQGGSYVVKSSGKTQAVAETGLQIRQKIRDAHRQPA